VENVSFGFHNAGSAWHNQPNPADVNGDGLVTTQDLLDVVQYLRNHGLGVLQGEPEEGASLIDADGDGVAGPNDLLVVITQLRAQIQQQGNGEGEPVLLSGDSENSSAAPLAESAAEGEDPASAPEPLWTTALQVRLSPAEPSRHDEGDRPQEARPRTRDFVDASERLGAEAPGRSIADRLASPARSAGLEDDDFESLLTAIALDIADDRRF
jgi:hypothetical protein